MTFEIAITPCADQMPHARPVMRYDVLLNGRKYSELVHDGSGYVGILPTPEHGLENADGHGIHAWKRRASEINRRAAMVERLIRDGRSAGLTTVIDRARETSAEFFEEIGVTPGEVHAMGDANKLRIQDRYVDWLYAKIEKNFDDGRDEDSPAMKAP